MERARSTWLTRGLTRSSGLRGARSHAGLSPPRTWRGGGRDSAQVQVQASEASAGRQSRVRWDNRGPRARPVIWFCATHTLKICVPSFSDWKKHQKKNNISCTWELYEIQISSSVNSVEYRHAHSCLYCLWLLLSWNGRAEWLPQTLRPAKPEMLPTWHFIEKVCFDSHWKKQALQLEQQAPHASYLPI